MSQRLKTKNYWQVVVNLFRDYSEHSTIHGVNYLTEKGRPWLEKIWWISAICAAILCCGKLLMDAWNIEPIIITFTEKPTPIWKVRSYYFIFDEIDTYNDTHTIAFRYLFQQCLYVPIYIPITNTLTCRNRCTITVWKRQAKNSKFG
jgi:Amiloride-sensitive sodium channel